MINTSLAGTGEAVVWGSSEKLTFEGRRKVGNWRGTIIIHECIYFKMYKCRMISSNNGWEKEHICYIWAKSMFCQFSETISHSGKISI